MHCCHCTWCQRETGSAFAVNALIETSAIEILQRHAGGSDLAVAKRRRSGPSCAAQAAGSPCGAYYSAAREKIAFVRAGTLDDPAQTPPDIHIFTSSKQPWVVLPEGVPAMAEYYRRSSYWPAESVERYKKALAESVVAFAPGRRASFGR